MAPKVLRAGMMAVKKVLKGSGSRFSAARTQRTEDQVLNLDEVSRDVFGEEEEMEVDPPVVEDMGKGPMEEDEGEGSRSEEKEGIGSDSGSGSEYEEGESGGEDEGEEERVVQPEVVETTTRPAKKSRTAEEELRGSEPRFLEHEAKALYERLKRKKFENSRCLDPKVLRDLGIEADFYALTENVDITRAFWEIVELAYTRLTIEFLCTLRLKWIKDAGEFEAKWTMHGVPISRMESEIADIFGLRR